MSPTWLHDDVAVPVLSAATIQLEYLALRALPFCVYGLVASALGWRRRAGFALGLAAIAVACMCWPRYQPRVLSDLLALTYYVAAVCVVWALARSGAALVSDRASTFALCLALFIFVPAAFFGLIAAIPMLALGWCAALSAYSYCRESRSDTALGLRRCLLFVLIDPTLVYPERARPAAGVSGCAAWTRLGQGLVRMTVATLALGVLIPFAHTTTRVQHPGSRYVLTMLATLPAFCALYWLRAGFADVQIAFTRMLGHSLGECFDRPYLARSPGEFWRRWNMYVGRWAQRYVFAPLLLALARRHRAEPARAWLPALDRAIAILATFLVLGLLHDPLNYAGEGGTRFVFLQVFTFAAVTLLIWEGWIAALRARRGTPGLLGPAISRVCLAHYVVGVVLLSGALG
ncbi:MAG TPA: hypothetical protein VFZ61_14825 [Polyangiales bacterium]